MWTPSLRLEATGLDPLELSAESGYIPQSVDLGFPVAREVVQNAPDADGTIDTTTYFGARNITCPLVLDSYISGVALEEMEDRLRPFLLPSRRSVLIGLFREGGSERRAVVRGSQWSGVIDARDHRPVAVQWVCPSGIIESAELHTVTAGAGGEVAQSGLTFDATPDFSFGGATPASGGAVATNDGNVPVWPVVTMYGPFSAGTILRNDTTGLELEFVSTMSIVAGDYLVVDFAAKTIVNSTGTSYYDSLDFAGSQWWQLAPGENRIYMLPTTFTAPPASFLVEWRAGWL